jgi:tetratricopeptide (TPR) repeat protein
MGDSYRGLKNISNAVQCYTSAIEKDPESKIRSLFKRGKLYMRIGCYEQSREDFNLITQMEHQNTKAHFLLGKALNKLGKIGDAVLHYEQVIKNS